MLVDAALKVSRSNRAAAVATFMSHTSMLREAPLANLATVLRSMICSGNKDVLARDVAIEDPAQLTVQDAAAIGDGISSIRRGHMAPGSALAEILTMYPALRATARQSAWFEPMLEAMLIRRMAVSTGKKVRLLVGTALSLLDVGTDISTILLYYLSSQSATASLIMAMVCLSIAIQSVVVVIRNRHRSTGEIAKELLILLSFLKPVIDLQRLMGGHEVDGAPFDTATERNICKIIETACESVPISIISMVALLRSETWAWEMTLAIFISWITTAYKATSLSFDFDTDRSKRQLEQWFVRACVMGTSKLECCASACACRVQVLRLCAM
jgi:uncharacterized membrane protein YhdT